MKNKIEGLLSRITTLEKHFDSNPGDLGEQRCREDVIRYAVALAIVFYAQFLPASSRTSENDCVLSLRSLNSINLMVIPLKATEKFPDSSKTCERPSSTTRSVRKS